MKSFDLGTQITPHGLIFWTRIFYELKKKLYQDQSNEGSIYILSSLEVAQFAQLTNYMKLQILASHNNLKIGQDSEFAQF